MIPSEWIDQADERIAPHIVRTPLTHDAARNLYVKWENRQKTGSFKARGALNKILGLEDWEREAGIVTASAGNHGQGVALAGQLTGAQVTCFVSEHAVPVKVNAIRALGAEIIVVAGGYPEAEAAGRNFAAQNHKTWVSPYNDGQVIAGQGTIGLEVVNQITHPSLRGGWFSRRSNPPSGEETASSLAVTIVEGSQIGNLTYFVPVSGGGLIAGIGAALAGLGSRPRLVGVQPESAPFMHGLFYRGSQDGIPDLPSLADGLTGAVESDSVTIPMVKQLVDEIVLVSEEEIARAVAFAFTEYGETIEPSGAVTIAAALREVERNGIPLRGNAAGDHPAPRVAIVSGGNIQPEVHARIVAEFGKNPVSRRNRVSESEARA